MTTNNFSFRNILHLTICLLLSSNIIAQKKYSKSKLKKHKTEAASIVNENHKQTQVMIDKIFSFAELGFHEIESSKYLTNILESSGFSSR